MHGAFVKHIVVVLFFLSFLYSQQQSWEDTFRSIPTTENLREYMQHLSARPHHPGSPYDKENAKWILAKFKKWGWDAHIETFDVLFPTPKERLLEMTAPTHFTAALQEPALRVDPTSDQQNEQLPTYNAYSVDGDVTAPLVYVNYGIPSDYEQLDRMGISVKGCIVIARYGASWRGIKPKVAAEHGAVGCIIYSDPIGDGYVAGDVFPKGAYRNSEGVQRGSVMDMPLHPGDPLTPGVGATKHAKRLTKEESGVLTKIPVLPISYADAQPLLASLSGPVPPRSWRGGLPITYHIGPGETKVHLKLKFNWDLVPINDVIAVMKGSEYPDEWIIRGNHHDAWVNGAEDPISGQICLLEEARAFGELKKQGWKPKRTLVYCAWDGEEQGLLGSTEWAEAHADELKQKAVLYLNSDSNGRGYLYAEGSHSLESFVNDIARDIVDPETKLSVWKRDQASDIMDASSKKQFDERRSQSEWKIGAMGSGSDYTVFIDYLGISSLNFGFGGEDGGGIYHSIYDDFYWYTHFSDTNFVYCRALAQTAGTAMMRAADADILPFQFTNLASTIHGYVGEVQDLLKKKREEAQELNAKIDDGLFAATTDPHETFVPPSKKEIPPYLNFAPLENADDSLTQCAKHFSDLLSTVKQGKKSIPESANKKMYMVERSLTSPDGLPNRPWFKHQIYAPGFYTGYGVKTLPGVREAIEEGNWKLAQEQIEKEAIILNNAATAIAGVTKELAVVK